MGVLQTGENLSFGLKAMGKNLSPRGNSNDFDSHLLFLLAIGAFGQKDGAHAAVSKFFKHAVGANMLKRRGDLNCRDGRAGEKIFGLLMSG